MPSHLPCGFLTRLVYTSLQVLVAIHITFHSYLSNTLFLERGYTVWEVNTVLYVFAHFFIILLG